MKKVSEFSFACRDGLHHHIYNPNSKISSLLVIKGTQILSREDCLCSCEEYHIRRVQWDFNHNSLQVQQIHSRAKLRSLIVDILLNIVSWILVSFLGVVYLSLSCVIKILEVLNVGKKSKPKSSIAL
jgi:hypothetical protein